jgi:hydrogenase maturation protease
MTAPAPLLVFAWGNRSRGDDALGPLFVERLRAAPHDPARIELLDDHQLMIEHVLDLQGRERVLFVDASRACAAPFEATVVAPGADASIGSHRLSPAALLHVYAGVLGRDPPPCMLLAIRGEAFELGAEPTAAALGHLDAALQWAQGWLRAAPAGLAGVVPGALRRPTDRDDAPPERSAWTPPIRTAR